MLVCPRCGAEASSWAARCPGCRGSLEGAASIPDPDPLPEPQAAPAPDLPPPNPRRHRRSWAVPAIVAACALLGLPPGLLALRKVTNRRGSPAPGVNAAPSPPAPTAGQGIYTLVYTDPDGRFLVAPPDGNPLQLASPGERPGPLVAVGPSVVWHRAGQIFSLTRPFLGVRAPLGPGDLVFPSSTSGLVGVLRGGDAGPFSIAFVPPAPGLGIPKGPFPIPGGYQPIAETPSGILVSQLPQGVLKLWQPSTKGFGTFVRTFGTSTDVVGVSGDQVAWRALGSCSAGLECPLHISSISTGRDLVVTPPEGHLGFVGGGAFDPIGMQVAAFVAGSSGGTVPRVQLALAGFAPQAGPPTVGWSATVVPGSLVAVGAPRGAAVWSPDGNRVFFSGLNGALHSYHPGNASADTLNRQASYNFVVF